MYARWHAQWNLKPGKINEGQKTLRFPFFKKRGIVVEQRTTRANPTKNKLGNIQFALIVTALRESNIDGNRQITYHLSDN